MITPNKAINEVRKLMYTVSFPYKIFAGEISTETYSSLMNAKEKFIVINALPVTFMQVQEATVNVNLYAPNKANGTTDLATLDAMLELVKPLIEDAYTDLISTELSTVTQLFEEPNYTYYNLRIETIGINLNKNQNIKP